MTGAMPEDDVLVSGVELASVLGFRPSYLVELKKAGRLVPGPGGKGYWKSKSTRLFYNTADPGASGVAQRHAAARGGAPAPMAVGNGGAGEGEAQGAPAAPTFAVSESPDSQRRAKALADQAEAAARKALRDEAVELGELLPAADVLHASASAGATFRVAMERMVDAAAPRLAAISDEAAVRSLLWDEVNHALGELARNLRGMVQEAA